MIDLTMGITHFWRLDKHEILKQLADFRDPSTFKYLYCPAVIQHNRPGGPLYFPGYWAQSEKFKTHYQPTSKEQLPDEFKLALLIAGVQL